MFQYKTYDLLDVAWSLGCLIVELWLNQIVESGKPNYYEHLPFSISPLNGF